MSDKKKLFKEKLVTILVFLDWIFYKLVEKVILWRVKKTNMHKYRVYRKLMIAEAQIMFYGSVLLPILFSNSDITTRLMISLFFVAMFSAVYWWRFNKNKREIKEYDPLWGKRDIESVQAKVKIECAREIVWFGSLRIKITMVLLLVIAWYNAMMIATLLVNNNFICDIARMLSMNIYFLCMLIDYYISLVYDLGSGGKVKEKKEMTETQKSSWRRLLETFNPAPTN